MWRLALGGGYKDGESYRKLDDLFAAWIRLKIVVETLAIDMTVFDRDLSVCVLFSC